MLIVPPLTSFRMDQHKNIDTNLLRWLSMLLPHYGITQRTYSQSEKHLGTVMNKAVMILLDNHTAVVAYLQQQKETTVWSFAFNPDSVILCMQEFRAESKTHSRIFEQDSSLSRHNKPSPSKRNFIFKIHIICSQNRKYKP